MMSLNSYEWMMLIGSCLFIAALLWKYGYLLRGK